MLLLQLSVFIILFATYLATATLDYFVTDKRTKKHRIIKRALIAFLFVSLAASISLTIVEHNKSQAQGEDLSKLRKEVRDYSTSLKEAEKEAKGERAQLTKTIEVLNKELTPFVDLAQLKFPGESTSKALELLRKELKETKEMAAPNTIEFSSAELKEKEGAILATLQFKPKKNIPLGFLSFSVTVSGDSNAKILDLWPSLIGGAIQTGPESKKIASDGKSAVLTYSLVGAGLPTIDLTLSGPARVVIEGNNGLLPFGFEVRQKTGG